MRRQSFSSSHTLYSQWRASITSDTPLPHIHPPSFPFSFLTLHGSPLLHYLSFSLHNLPPSLPPPPSQPLPISILYPVVPSCITHASPFSSLPTFPCHNCPLGPLPLSVPSTFSPLLLSLSIPSNPSQHSLSLLLPYTLPTDPTPQHLLPILPRYFK